MSPMGPQERYDAVVVCQHAPTIFHDTTEKNGFKGSFAFFRVMTKYALR